MRTSLITVFTPAYNRSRLLNRLYNSLVNQTDQRFVWLIVDDGSVDDTAEMVSSWKNEGKIIIEYIYQKNQGKHVAHNTGVNNTDTEFFYTVDSDDELTCGAIASICEAITDIMARPDIAGLIAKKGYHNGDAMCTKFPEAITEVSIRDIYKIYNLKGELALVFKTEIMKEFLFPVFGSEKFVTEAVILNLISVKYKMKLLNNVICLCEYLQDGCTNSLRQIHQKNPVGYHYYLVQEIEIARTAHELKCAYANYITGCWKIGYKVKLSKKNIIKNLPLALVHYIKLILKDLMKKTKYSRYILKQVFRVQYL